ncbi:C-type lectin domain family 4 member F [Echinops telfairi]|uniref:C-type lectin domain family 4 member F n=1 Tax=Echinops telfairi TaxID=9371 RepID=A0AC55DEF1_ECHTE|nr:C-type lectin domain family 4 member F [Echinops telfairi]
MKEAVANGTHASFCTDSQCVSLHPRGMESAAVAPAAPKVPRLAQAMLAFVAVTLAFFLVALFVVVLQRSGTEDPSLQLFQAAAGGDNTTSSGDPESLHPSRVAEVQEALQMLKVQVENTSTWSVEIQMLKCSVDNVSSQIQMLSGHLEHANADIQMIPVLNENLKNANKEIQVLKRGLQDGAALKTQVRTLGGSLQKASADIQRLQGDLRSTRTLTAQIQEKQNELETLRSGFASQEQLQRTQNELLKLILNGWKVYNRHLYYFSDDKKSWHGAEQFCVSQGAHLASVTSAGEQKFLTMSTSASYHWIGLTDRGREGSWRWVDGTPFNAAQSTGFWDPNQPDNWQHKNGQTEDCVHVEQKWNDMDCGATYQWVCKKPVAQGLA